VRDDRVILGETTECFAQGSAPRVGVLGRCVDSGEALAELLEVGAAGPGGGRGLGVLVARCAFVW
jgi:hypothetical protein